MSRWEIEKAQRQLNDKENLTKLKCKLDGEKSLRIAQCPQCKEEFILAWNDYSDKSQTVVVRACPSGGVYDVSIECPFCDYKEEL